MGGEPEVKPEGAVAATVAFLCALAVAVVVGWVGGQVIVERGDRPVPAVTITETQMKPGPTRTTLVPVPGPTVTRTVPASRSRTLYDWIDVFARCVHNHESANAGLYKALNGDSGASGAYQFLDSTWANVSRRAGHPGYAKAMHAPPDVQDAVFRWTVLYDAGHQLHWKGTNCGYGT